ncbi:hypothetical protein FA09DRAFT_359285 [Tilletiopsis washingtonensis]|uniref:Uncharacterized protein n=1 Tax=Tilletiopsis washingtonensis TaxID=58919 RepID=A0A316ZHZ5_9BASI|nr:hypothetical protein FA09DRAFT_359285 [Tilletiopsis washingtonensis]PWN99893.1 hypothetical protein FA09DRAFT_359285 [Tilletiopsis washingtonensis]
MNSTHASGSSTSAPSVSLLTLPAASPYAEPQFLLLTCTPHAGALLVHVCAAPPAAIVAGERAAAPPPPPQQTHAETPAERDQRLVDEAADGDLERALAAAQLEAGRDAAPAPGSAQPVGALAREWAVAMARPGQRPGTEALGTALFRTPADVALPIAKRLARRLQLPQLLLSLDLPPLGEPGAPETSAAMLGLERGLLDALRAHVAAQGGASIA